MTNEERYEQAHKAAVVSLCPCGDPEQDHLLHEVQEPWTEDAFAAIAPHEEAGR